MARIVEKLHDQRLKKFGINIKTKYKSIWSSTKKKLIIILNIKFLLVKNL